jgi:hypothetical protein
MLAINLVEPCQLIAWRRLYHVVICRQTRHSSYWRRDKIHHNLVEIHSGLARSISRKLWRHLRKWLKSCRLARWRDTTWISREFNEHPDVEITSFDDVISTSRKSWKSRVVSTSSCYRGIVQCDQPFGKWQVTLRNAMIGHQYLIADFPMEMCRVGK